MMMSYTPASAIPCSLAISGGTPLDGGSLAVDQLQRQPVDGRTDCGQVAQFAPPERRRNVADPGDGSKDEVTDGSRCSRIRRSRADEVAQPILYLLLPIGDQLFLGREVVVDGLLGDFGLARDVYHGNVLVAALREQPSRRVSDESAGACLLTFAESGAVHPYQSRGCPKSALVPMNRVGTTDLVKVN